MVILGPCGAGKTVLMHKLCTGEAPLTTTTMKAGNQMYAKTGSEPIQVVDYPGHAKLRSQLAEFLLRGNIVNLLLISFLLIFFVIYSKKDNICRGLF